MNERRNGQPDEAEPSSHAALLPWYATARLSLWEQAELEAALADDAGLRSQLALVRDEAADTIALNESLKTPPVAVMDRLMAKIDHYEAQHPRGFWGGIPLLSWLSDALSALSPRVLAGAALAAAVIICLEGGFLTSLLIGRQETVHFKTASEDTTAERTGTYALVAFVGTVPMQELSGFLQDHHVVLIDGPKPGGFYRIKLAEQKLVGEALNARLAELRAQTNIVSFVLPETTSP